MIIANFIIYNRILIFNNSKLENDGFSPIN